GGREDEGGGDERGRQRHPHHRPQSPSLQASDEPAGEGERRSGRGRGPRGERTGHVGDGCGDPAAQLRERTTITVIRLARIVATELAVARNSRRSFGSRWGTKMRLPGSGWGARHWAKIQPGLLSTLPLGCVT